MTTSSDFSDMYTFTVHSIPPSANAALSPHPRLQTSYPSYAHFISSSSAPSQPSFVLGCSSDSLRVLQWNAGGLRARSTKLLYFLSSHLVGLICIQESNLNSSSSFRILRSDCTHSRSGILSPDDTHTSGGVVIFIRQGLSFSELSTSSLSSLYSYSGYEGVNIPLNNSYSLSLSNVCAPYTLLSNGWQNRLLFSRHSSLLQKSFHSGGLQLPSSPLGLKRYFRLLQRGSIQLSHLF